MLVSEDSGKALSPQPTSNGWTVLSPLWLVTGFMLLLGRAVSCAARAPWRLPAPAACWPQLDSKSVLPWRESGGVTASTLFTPYSHIQVIIRSKKCWGFMFCFIFYSFTVTELISAAFCLFSRYLWPFSCSVNAWSFFYALSTWHNKAPLSFR